MAIRIGDGKGKFHLDLVGWTEYRNRMVQKVWGLQVKGVMHLYTNMW